MPKDALILSKEKTVTILVAEGPKQHSLALGLAGVQLVIKSEGETAICRKGRVHGVLLLYSNFLAGEQH